MMFNKYLNSYGDSILYDTKLAFNLSLLGFIFLSVMAYFGHTFWPGNFITESWKLDWSHFFYDLFRPMGVIFILIFIFSNPTYKEILIVLSGWVICLLIGLLLGWEHFYPALSHASFYKTTLSIPCTLIVLIKNLWLPLSHEDSLYNKRLRWLIFTLIIFIHILPSALMLTISLCPQILDLYVLPFDMLIVPHLTRSLVHFISILPKGDLIMEWSYKPIFILPLILSIQQLKGRPHHVPTVILVWIVVALCGVITYLTYPIIGPLFLFGSDFYNQFNPENYPAITLLSQMKDARNGMPSLHFSWTLLSTVLWWQTTRTIFWRFISLVYCILLALSTIYLGQHYFVDLIVAVPFSLGCWALANTNIKLTRFPRINIVLAGFLGCLIWIVSLYYPLYFTSYPYAINLLLVFTLIIVTYQSYYIHNFKSIIAKG